FACRDLHMYNNFNQSGTIDGRRNGCYCSKSNYEKAIRASNSPKFSVSEYEVFEIHKN
ncbi:5876_t:CDS:1, partial [Scutellospora calospora]